MSENSAKDRETRAEFVEEPQNRIGGNTSKVIRSALKKRDNLGKDDEDNGGAIVSSPLLTSTPATISKALVKLYPNLIVSDRILTLLTWTNDDIWPSVLMVLSYIAFVLYFETIAKYFGHIVVVAIMWSYSLLDKHVEETLSTHPTLDDIVFVMNRVITKADILLSPVTILSTQDIRKLLLTTVFLSPVYVIIALFILPPRKLLVTGGVYLLTYHSPWSKVTRQLLWKFKLVRLLVFYITGLDLGGISKSQGIFAAVHKQMNKLSSGDSGKGWPIRFTYVLYENQRRWLGIGWTSSMLSYERAPWTDEFFNEAPPPDQFQLPDENTGMVWRWVDKTWRLDMTNDGAIQLSSARAKTTASPNADDGFIYYDNTWKKPSTEDSFSKYTRRRRWIRTAELLKISDPNDESSSKNNSTILLNSENNHSAPTGAVTTATATAQSDNVKRRSVSFSDVKNVHIIPSEDEDEEGSEAKHEEEKQIDKSSETAPLLQRDAHEKRDSSLDESEGHEKGL
ncbi:related to Peroxisomal membrane protein PEX30 [Zygosaccharomyces bailii]|nr:related to Peroxisomal membrane protein PEX30 [Zygosaccharomyces bailii]